MQGIVVQIYEVQRPDEALALIGAGVDHIGSVLTSASRWKSETLQETICETGKAGARSSLIPLFSDVDQISFALDYYQPHIAHFCEDLTDADRNGDGALGILAVQAKIRERFPEIKLMRSIPIGLPGMADGVPTLALAQMFAEVSDYFLTDTLLTGGGPEQPVDGFVGITGKTCDWDMAERLVAETPLPVILAGGLSPDNVFAGALKVRPYGVDSCTCTNAVDENGDPVRFHKDLAKVSRFVAEARRAADRRSEPCEFRRPAM